MVKPTCRSSVLNSAAQRGQSGADEGHKRGVAKVLYGRRDSCLEIAIGGRPQVGGVEVPGCPQHALLGMVQHQHIVHRTVA